MLYKHFRVNRQQFMQDVIRASGVDNERRRMLIIIKLAGDARPEQIEELAEMQAAIMAAMSDKLAREGFVMDGLLLRQPADTYVDPATLDLVITQGEASI